MTNQEHLLVEYTNWDVKAEGKDLYLVGPMCVAETKNKNGRTYPKRVLENAAKKNLEENKDALWGTLGHEAGPQIDPMKISHLVTEMWWEGNVLFGRAKVLDERSPCGAQLSAMLRASRKIGMSSRGLGSVDESNVVKDDYRIVSIDAVTSPSGPGCWAKGMTEGVVLVEETMFAEVLPMENVPTTEDDIYENIIKSFALGKPKGKSHVDLNPTTNDSDDQQGSSQAAQTLKRRKEAAMKEGFAGGTSAPGGYGTKARDLTKDSKPNTRHKAQTVGRIREAADESGAAVHALLRAVKKHFKDDPNHPVSRRAKVLYDACTRCESFDVPIVDAAFNSLVGELAKLDADLDQVIFAEANDIAEGILGGLAAVGKAVASHVATRAAGAVLGSGGMSLVNRAASAFRAAQKPSTQSTRTQTVQHNADGSVKAATVRTSSPGGNYQSKHYKDVEGKAVLTKTTTKSAFKESVEAIVDDACYGLHPRLARSLRTACEQEIKTDSIEKAAERVGAIRQVLLHEASMQAAVNTMSQDHAKDRATLIEEAAERGDVFWVLEHIAVLQKEARSAAKQRNAVEAAQEAARAAPLKEKLEELGYRVGEKNVEPLNVPLTVKEDVEDANEIREAVENGEVDRIMAYVNHLKSVGYRLPTVGMLPNTPAESFIPSKVSREGMMEEKLQNSPFFGRWKE